jgi:hypothetical protein
MTRPRPVAFLIREFWEVLPPTLFFAGGFVLIEFTTQLILDDYFVRFANFLVAIGAALLVGKAVLVANMLPFLRRFDHTPLFRPILFKTVIYSLAVMVVRVLEKFVGYWLHDGTFGGFPAFLVGQFTWHRFIAIQLWVFVLFLIYTAITDLNARLGQGELFDLFFIRHVRSSKRDHRAAE